jgi:dUTPase
MDVISLSKQLMKLGVKDDSQELMLDFGKYIITEFQKNHEKKLNMLDKRTDFLEKEIEHQKSMIRDLNELVRAQQKYIEACNSKINALQSPRVVQIKYKKLFPDAITPSQGGGPDSGNIGYDLVGFRKRKEKEAENIKDEKKGELIFATGIAVEPEPGCHLKVYERSSFYLKHPGWIARIGIIDESYRGQIHIIATRVNPKASMLPDKINACQLIASLDPYIQWEEVEKLSFTKRGANKFGSTDALMK